ncbi:sulfate transporter [Histoplasma capsulatum H143]|uniref:Sulfate transporter n=1 Tax=Ajellomyces capsulatus (strain H143) TaxID=544712 RepID=C6HIN0_AJECH|nr:sulfate transporter [Histoplasma capsulatum H143]
MAPNSAGMRRRVSQSSIQPHQREVQDDLVRTQTDEGRSENISVSTSNTHYESQPNHGEENCSLPPMSFSTSHNERTPLRSFYHRSFRGSLDAGQYSSRGVREKTAELASLALFNRERDCTDSVCLEPQIGVPNNFGVFVDGQRDISRSPWTQSQPGQIEELSAADSRTGDFHSPPKASTSALTTMIRDFAPDRSNDGLSEEPIQEDFSHPDPALTLSRGSNVPATERTALLNPSRTKSWDGRTAPIDVEGQITRYKPLDKLRAICTRGGSRCFHRLNPQAWDRRVIWRKGIVYPIALLPAVFLGLLLNILDALSYGMILFPLGEPLFAHLAPDGISMFYVSTIVAQLVYSCGGSVFKGGVGSEMIEVVPFFHKIAFMILKKVGKQNEKAVLATTILSYAISSVLTGSVFFLMGAFNLGSLIGFFPRHILIGCIGGVGWFLVATGVMVSARLSGNLEYNLETLKRLFQLDTVFLWTLPLIGAIGLLVIKRFNKKAADNHLDFSSVHWSALAETIPAMFALTFFGVLHVPINVPALGISTGEDNLNVDRELLAHGISNAVSGFSVAFRRDARFRHIWHHAVGPGIISYIPVVIVGALIYMLGIELMEEALVDTLGKLHTLEYLTVVIIVVTMGAWDFVIGIVIGIILACVNFVVQTAQKSAITATYSGQVAISTVRRHPLHVRFLKDVGKQTFVIKLAGFLFFGTIVSVENTVRGLIEEKTFKDQPIRFLILDLKHVNGLDFSAAEAFTRLNRILWKRRVHMIISSIDVEGEIGKSLQNVGLFEKENEVEIFESLNSALEYSTTALREEEADPVSNKTTFQKWDSFQQPLPLLLQTFHGLTKHNEDFWFPACTYFTREVFPADSVLYRTGEDATNFYLLESGMLRAEYESPQGSYSELIVAGRPCGELPFFGETRRTATVRAERDSVVWRLGSEEWQQLRRKEPMLAQELMKIRPHDCLGD